MPRIALRRRGWSVAGGLAAVASLLVVGWLATRPAEPPPDAVIRGRPEWYSGLAYTPDGRTLIAAEFGLLRSDDLHLVLYDVASGRERGRIATTARLPLFAVAPDGRTLILGDRSRGQHGTDASAYDLATLRRITALEGTSSFLDAAFSADGETVRIVAARDDGADVTTWDATTWRERSRVPLPEVTPLHLAALSPAAELLAVARPHTGRTVTLIDLATGEVRATFDDPAAGSRPIVSLAFRPDGRAVLAGHDGGLIGVLDVATGRSLATFGGHDRSVFVERMTFTPDGRTLITAGTGLPRPYLGAGLPLGLDRAMTEWRGDLEVVEVLVRDAATGEPRSAIRDRQATVRVRPGSIAGASTEFAIAPDGRSFATPHRAHKDGTISIRNLAPGMAGGGH